METAKDILTRIDVRGLTGDLAVALPALEMRGRQPVEAVRDILEEVKADGDAALRSLTSRFDGVQVDDLRVPADEVKAALDEIPAGLREAMEAARDNIQAFHRIQIHPDGRLDRAGMSLREVRQPVARAGLYIPGGRAPLGSTVLMTAVPARVAGVGEVIMCSPPGPDGRIAPSIRAAAAIAGVDEVYRVGGAQAVAAMAYGTETIRPVDVIVGPGNRFVALAQRFVSQEGAVGVPSAFAGPSEVAVVADDTTPVEFAAVDLVVQA
ncbi:MAG: histidinol dehydrogenase, partial [Acidimicrobiaceae bacterium]|nr:histidinol dehydrogenase [Acidimicrobiaceae bacterium]